MPDKPRNVLEAELAQLKQEFEDFAYIVSHDLSGPLRHASSFAEMVLSNKDDSLDENSKRHLTYIIESAEKGRHALELLRDYSRLNTREFLLSEAVDLNETIQDVLMTLQDKIINTKAVIPQGSLPKIKCAPELIKRAFEYLIDNALTYYSKSKTPVIHISYEETTAHFIFAVEDKGTGIIENRKEDIFKIFKRAVEQNDYPGDGMGLALTKRIAQKHEGDVRVETKEGEGSTFYFSVSKDL